MAKRTYKINGMLQGVSPTQYVGYDGSFDSSIAIDPDLPVSTSGTRTSGVAVPVAYTKFSATEIASAPLWIITQIKTTNSFVYTAGGILHSFDSDIAMRATDEASTALPITITGGAGNGAAYYNNYIYLLEATDVSRYGGMNQGASIAKTENVWTGATLGSQTALTNTTYPSLRGVAIPNHAAHVHGDNALYFCDVVNGQGVIHKIKTSKTTIEGDTNNGSTFNGLDLPFGWLPVDIESYSTDLCILAIQSTSAAIKQGNAALFFWNTIDDSFYRGPVFLQDPIATALKNVNGTIRIWSGNGVSGVRVSEYLGGEVIREIAYQEDGLPPFAGAVDALGSRTVWGGFTAYPEVSASVSAIGSKRSSLPQALHNVARATSAGASPNVTSLAYVQQASSITPRLILGWKDDSASGLDSFSTSGTLAAVYRTPLINVGSQFRFLKIKIPFGAALTTNMTCIPTLYVDDLGTSLALTTINSTNYSGRRTIIYRAPELNTIGGAANFLLQLRWTGTVQLPVIFPIEIEIEEYEDQL